MSSFAPIVEICGDAEDMSAAARRIIIQAVSQRDHRTPPVVVALSGGSTPKRLYEMLHEKDLSLLQGHAVRFVLGDERLVSRDDDRSNFSMATKALLHDVPSADVIGIDPSAALSTSADETSGVEGAWKVAQAYERALLEHLPSFEVDVNGAARTLPVLDIVLLGFGSDGHTASIFPNSIAAHDDEHVVSVSFPSPTMNPKIWRVTLSKTVIQHAKHVVVLAGGKDKNWVVRGILADAPTDPSPVARFLRDCRGTVTLLLDAASGEGISISEMSKEDAMQ